MSASALPSKLFFRIGEVASLVGVEPHVLRYWEREFRSIRPTKSAKGQRVYSRKDVENLLRVRDLLYRDGFTIAGAKKRLQRGVSFDPQTEQATDLLQQPDDESEAQTGDEIDTDAENDVEEEEEVALAEPASGPRSHSTVEVRAKLTALRLEIEGFLDDLESGAER
jgi:DNA-binding transcriptional MerR regulator